MRKQAVFSIVVILSLLLQSCTLPFTATTPIAAGNRSIASIEAELNRSATNPNPSEHSTGTSPATIVDTTARSKPIGTLRLPVELDADEDAATNPLAGVPVPVVHIWAQGSTKTVDVTQVTLGVEVAPHDANHNPAGVTVNFRLWNDGGSVELADQVRADAWGATTTQFQLMRPGRYHYQASAAGYGETEVRTFAVDPQQYATEILVNGLRLTTQTRADGRTVVLIESDLPLDDRADAITLQPFRYLPKAALTDQTEVETLPPMSGERIDTHHARLTLDLEPGVYALAATAQSGNTFLKSTPLPVQVARGRGHGFAALTTSGAGSREPGTSDDGETATGLQSEFRNPQSATPPTFTKIERRGAFKWHETTYQVQVKTLLDDRKKLAFLDDFEYDPIARSYNISIHSLMTQTVQDKVTVQALGPNDVILYEETAPITLDPAQPTRYTFSVPSDKGEPRGVRIIVHDPSAFEESLTAINTRISALFTSLVAAATGGDGSSQSIDTGFSFTVSLVFLIQALDVPFIDARYVCAFTPSGNPVPNSQCSPTIDGVLFRLEGGTLISYLEDKLSIYLHNTLNMTLQEAFQKGVKVGDVTFKVPLTFRYTKKLIDAGSCTDQQALNAAQNKIRTIGDRLENEANRLTSVIKGALTRLVGKRVEAPVGPTPPLNFIFGVLGFKRDILDNTTFDGGYTENTDGVFFNGGVEFGVSAEARLKPPLNVFVYLALVGDSVGLAFDLYNVFNATQTVNNTFEIIRGLQQFNAGGGCPPPGGGGGRGGNGMGGGKKGGNGVPYPGAGYPDDRLDAFQNEFLPNPAGVSGNLQILRQQATAAQAAGLTRAVKYFTYSIRQLELVEFVRDTGQFNAFTTQLQSIAASTAITMQAVISGTVAPDPGKTITETVEALYFGAFDQIAQTPYRQQEQALQDAFDFAERQYMELRGQELELQLELRKLSGGVAILDSGIWSWTLTAIGTIGVLPKLISMAPGDPNFVSPLAAPPVLFVPSGGLNDYQGNLFARQWLEAYVGSGGTLIVLTQYENEDWELLPGGEVRGLGYKDDILCKDASVHIVNPSVWITGVERDFPDIQIDGSFTDWPSNATIIWQRRTGNEKPAMIEYRYGLGQVVATAAYPDFYINGMQSADDVTFARSLFSIGYLRANNENVVTTVSPNSPVSLNLSISNTLATTATTVLLARDAYETRIGESWRWAVHAPYLGLGGGQQTMPLSPVLLSGQSRQITYNFTAPARSGVYRISDLVRGQFGQSAPHFGQFYQVRSGAVAVDLFNARLTQNQDAYAIGETATLTVTLRNDQSVARTFVITPELGLAAPVVTLDAAPHQTVTKVYTTRVNAFGDVRLRVGANGRLLSTLVTTLQLRRPTLGFSLNPQRTLAQVATPVQITVTARDANIGSPVDFLITHNDQFVISATVPLADVGGYGAATANLTLPPAPPDTVYQLRAELDDPACGVLACLIRQAIPVIPIATLRTLNYTNAPLRLGQNNPGALTALILGSPFNGTHQLQTELRSNGTALSISAPVAGAVPSGLANITLDLPLPTALPLNDGLQTTATLAARADGSTLDDISTLTLPFTLNPPVFTLLDPTRSAGEQVRLQLTSPTLVERNQPILLPPGSPLTVTLLATSNSFSQTIIVNNAVAAGDRLDFSFTLPATLARGGKYQVKVASPHVIGFTGSATLTVPDNALALEAPATLVAGQPAAFALRNRGGINTLFNGAVRLFNDSGLEVATTSINESIAVGTAFNGNLAIPLQLGSGGYKFLVEGVNHLGESVRFSAATTLAGLTPALKVRTDQVAYLSTDQVNTTNVVTTNLPLDTATLRLRVIKPGSGGGLGQDWRANRGDSGNNNYAAANFTQPFNQAWSVSHGNYPAGNPLSVNGMVIVVDTAEQKVQARAATDGQLVWATAYDGYGFDVRSLAANSTKIFALVGDTVVALDALSGVVQWSTIIGSDTNPPILASDTALAIQFTIGGGDTAMMAPGKGKGGLAALVAQIGVDDGYILLDPASGVQRGLVAQTTPAVLVGNQLFLWQNDGVSPAVAAYDALTGTALWTTPVVASLEVIAANASYVLAFDNNSKELHLFDPATGSLLRTLIVDPGFSPGFPLQSFTLNASAFHYTALQYGSGGNGLSIFTTDLSTGSQTLLYNSFDFDFRGLLSVGAQLYVLRETVRSLVLIDAASGSELGQVDLSGIPDISLNGLIVGRNGPLVVTDANVVAFNAANSGGAAVADQILREDLLIVNGNGVIPLNTALINPSLAADPRARGQLVLDGMLFAREPQSIADPTRRQLLARSRYSFRIDDSSASVALVADQTAVRQNIAGYAPDDALSLVTLNGLVRNTSPLASDITVTVQRSDGATIFSQTYTNVAANAAVNFAIAESAPPTGRLTYTATTSLSGQAVTQLTVRPPDLNATVTLSPTSIVLGEVTNATLVLQNRNADTPGVVTVNWGDLQETVVLDQGQTLTRTHDFTPGQIGLFNPPIVLIGDTTATLQAATPVTVRDESVDVAASLSGVTRNPATLVQTADAALDFTVTNRSANPFDVAVSYIVNSPLLEGATTVSLAAAETQTIHVPINGLPSGVHSATFTVKHARLGTTLGVSDIAFDLVAPQTTVNLQAQLGDISPTQEVPILIAVTGDGANDVPFQATLLVEGALSLRQEFTVEPGTTFQLTPVLSLATLTGQQSITIKVIGPDGASLAHHVLTANGQLRQASAAQLVSLSATPGNAGELVTLTATVNNPGPDGEAVLTFTAFDQTVEKIATLPANASAQVTQTIMAPAALPDGLFPASVTLDDQTQSADIAISGVKIDITQQLDAAVYQPFTNATYTVHLQGVRGAPAQYDVMLRHGGDEFMQTVTVGEGSSANVAWTFNVGQIGERASVLVRNHANSPTEQVFTLFINSLYVRVIEDSRAWLESDKMSYNAGDTVNLTLHLLQPVVSALVIAPDELPDTGYLLWSSTQEMLASGVITGAVGNFPISFALPTTMRTGRYFLRLLLDGDEHTLPIDVYGINLNVEDLTVERPAETLASGDAVTLSARLRLNQAVNNARIETYVLAPDGQTLSLGAGATVVQNLAAGVNLIRIPGVFSSTQTGAHQFVLAVRAPDTLELLGGDGRFVQAGAASLVALETDHGVYAPGAPATGLVSIYNTTPAALVVRTSGGTELLNQTVTTTGYQQFSFTPPTAAPMDEVLIATLTAGNGAPSTLQRAYKVAAAFDISAPQITIQQPIPPTPDGVVALRFTTPAPYVLTVSGTVIDASPIVSLTVNSVPATVNGQNWSATLALPRGTTLLQVRATDAAGNVSSAGRSVSLEPDYGITLNLTPATLNVGAILQVTSVITAADRISATVSFPFSASGFAPTGGSATSGALNLTLSPANPDVSWQGDVTPGVPVTIQWTAQATAAQTGSAFALADGFDLDVRVSKRVDYVVNGTTPTPTPPDTTITSQPPSLSTSSSADFTFTGTDDTGVARFECSLDNVAFATCTTPKSYSGLVDGSHTFQVRAVDAGGTVDPTPATYTWTVRFGTTVAGCGSYPVYRDRQNVYFAPGWSGTIKVGTSAKNTLTGTEGADLMLGLGGNDTLNGQGGDDVLCGGDGVDLVQGFAGNDLLDGGTGNDVLNGGTGDFDQMLAGVGNDVLLDGDGVKIAQGDAGNDVFTLALRNGWRDPNGQARFTGLAAGYGNDAVALAILNTTPFFLDITGDERDNPPSPLEGKNDGLVLAGVITPDSVIIKFEKRLAAAADAEASIPSEDAGVEYLSEPAGEEVSSEAAQMNRVFLPVVTR